MITPVGLTGAQSCAALRAGISAMAELEMSLEIEYERVPVMGCAIGVFTEGYAGLGRWTRLATAALRDLALTTRLSASELGSASLYLALPSIDRTGVDDRIPQLLGRRIAEWLKVPALSDRTFVFPHGHAAAAGAVALATEHLRANVTQRAIVCGVDSLVEKETVEFLFVKRRLKIADHLDGFVPGEAAACLLLEQPAAAKARGATPLAMIDGAATATESATIWSDAPSTAVGLSAAIRSTVGQQVMSERVLVFSDLNGETYRAKEFGNSAVRALSQFMSGWALSHPADCIGDTGSAAFTVSMCLGARALAKGYAKGNQVLVLGSSDNGLRGAVSLRRASLEG